MLHDISSRSPLTQQYLGYNTIGGTTDVIGAGAFKTILKKVTLAQPSLICSLDAYVKGNSSNVHSFQAAIFDDNAGAPGKLIAALGSDTGSVRILNAALTTTARWLSFPMSVYLAAVSYWIAIVGGNQLTFHYDSGGTDQTTSSTDTWFNDGDLGTNSSRTYSLRASLLF